MPQPKRRPPFPGFPTPPPPNASPGQREAHAVQLQQWRERLARDPQLAARVRAADQAEIERRTGGTLAPPPGPSVIRGEAVVPKPGVARPPEGRTPGEVRQGVEIVPKPGVTRSPSAVQGVEVVPKPGVSRGEVVVSKGWPRLARKILRRRLGY